MFSSALRGKTREGEPVPPVTNGFKLKSYIPAGKQETGLTRLQHCPLIHFTWFKNALEVHDTAVMLKGVVVLWFRTA